MLRVLFYISTEEGDIAKNKWNNKENVSKALLKLYQNQIQFSKLDENFCAFCSRFSSNSILKSMLSKRDHKIAALIISVLIRNVALMVSLSFQFCLNRQNLFLKIYSWKRQRHLNQHHRFGRMWKTQ